MRIAICDDNRREQEQLVEALRGWAPTRVPECFFDGASLLAAAEQSPPFDIVFLDIYMPGENGVDIAKALRAVSPETGVVFVTTSREHAVDAFSLDALHYLVKPVTTDGVVEAFRRLSQLHAKKRPMITLSTGRESRAVYLDEICRLQAFNHAVEITLTGGRMIKVWMPLNELSAKLDDSFLQINRGTVVNMDYIEQMGVDTCLLRDGTRLELTRREHTAIRGAYDDYLFSKLTRRKGYDEEVGP